MSDAALDAFVNAFGPEFGHGKPLGLEQLRSALESLGAPQRLLPPVIHVAGTNGKGSTIAFMRAIAEAAGLRVHAFTKPHLHALRERYTIASEIASTEVLIAAASRVAAAAPALTQFEAQIAAAFLLFAEMPADLVLLETGMGGRDDSTNVIEHPALCVITPIDLDHTDALGGSIGEIAHHKAGIIKPGVPAIAARQTAEAQDALVKRAAKLSAPLSLYGEHWDAFLRHGRLVVQTPERVLDLPPPTLFGPHQIDNAGLACAAMLKWRALPDAAFARGVAQVRWPGRLQALTRGPLSAPIRALGGELWVDGGHNAQAAQALALALRQMQARRAAPTIAIIGLRARKDSRAFLHALAPALAHLIAVPLDEDHIDPLTLSGVATDAGVASENAASLAEALEKAARCPAPRILICGSLLLAAEALAAEGA
ncbi:MAG: folylpolyglutamate synthase/dihydrofolate synthase family protein [Hyphomonadaceae bacterium]